MVVQGLLALALALPTGMLFGVGYGTGVRIGYEQVYPLLFPQTGTERPSATQTAENIKNINKIYDTIGGKEASQMGIANGLQQAGELLNNPDFQVLEELESRLSSHTLSNSNLVNQSNATPTSGLISDSSLSETINTSLDQTNADIRVLLEEINDIPSLIRMRDREYEKPITSSYIIASINARISKLRSSADTSTIQDKQKEELAELEKEKLTNPAFQKQPNIGTNLGTITGSYQIAEYQNTIFSMSRDIQTTRSKIASLQATYNTQQAQNLSTATHYSKQIAIHEKLLATQIKKIQNYITISRNNRTLLSYANTDWRNRIWK